MTTRSDDVLIALRRIQQRTDQASKKLAQTVGLTPSQLMVLQYLQERGEISAGDIASLTQLKHATITALIDKMVARNFVSRRKCDEDRRRVWLKLEPAGEAIIRSAPNLLQDIFVGRFEKLPEWQQASLVAALEQVASILDAENIDAAPVLHAGEINEG
ncbi:MarR family winged helix-turn-helix transcriptional regulator [Fretibacter rubidus]|uniref:MarR family winged helix-turn-helix transcriptional regulator n=1 Tax=Fretibacter rubidus TaxID=570162 RepID=UPI00352BAA4D